MLIKGDLSTFGSFLKEMYTDREILFYPYEVFKLKKKRKLLIYDTFENRLDKSGIIPILEYDK